VLDGTDLLHQRFHRWPKSPSWGSVSDHDLIDGLMGDSFWEAAALPLMLTGQGLGLDGQ
jgi:hypothetical protein